jgi:glycosidase
MKHIIVIAGQRFITLLVAFGLLNPSAANLSMGADTIPSVGVPYVTPDQDWTDLLTTEPADSHDNQVEWDGLGHDSRDTLYRTPAGPVATGTSVTLRLRAASGDLTAAKVRLFNDRQNTLSILDMSLVVDDGVNEWWQVTLQPPSLATVYWYRFIAVDGSDVDYYADDDDLLGGVGNPTDAEVDNSWQLTFYDPAFHSPDWVKNAIIYEIFPDRFSDGDTSNNALPDIYYGEDSAIFRSGTIYWNEEICDPLKMNDACTGIYGENFYGGDLQGIINRLAYLKSLGVTTLYVNPIFKSPSNHGFDTTNYQAIDSGFGSNTLFSTFVTQAATQGMMVIMDGVFNYTSSDSVYFDRYKQYPGGVGACENTPSTPSYYRDWFFFYDVAPGTGPCTSSNGTENGADYLSWQGNDQLPLLNSSNREVQEQFWKTGTTTPIAPWWLSTYGAYGWHLDLAGEIDPGTLSNPANLYWEGFREAIHTVNPNAYTTGDEWGDASSWILGSEWDASTNHQLSTAILGYWRDEPFTDNDHYVGSAAGVISPLLPSDLNERLLNLQERYTPEAFSSMMNLLDSHDTNRALFMLDHNTDNNNSSLYWNPSYNWSDALTRLKGAVLLQMTLPGAPTIYYGDEVGLVGPVTFDTQANTWQDDPYNRQPFPWLGPSYGTPFYTFLQTQAGQDVMRNYYTLLTSARNTHPALRTGSFDPLLWDHPSVYAFGRRLLVTDDAAVIVLNRSAQAQSITLDLSGYLPATLSLVDILHNNAVYTIASDGSLTLNNIPAMSGLLLVYTSGDLTQPAAPLNLVAVEGESQITLTWNAVPDTSYQIFRSLLAGGGYELLEDSITSTEYTDTTVINGRQYYYVVRSVKPLGVVSEFSSEATALPHWTIDEANLQSPAEITHTIGLTATQPVYGQIFINELTAVPGAAPGILAQLGYGSAGTLPSEWTTWQDALFDSDQESYDQYAAPLLPEAVGEFQLVYRYSTTNGRDWVYADLDGLFIGLPPNPGLLHVLPSGDTTPPTTPANLTLDDWGDHFAALSWDPPPDDPSLYAYDIYRSTDISSSGVPIGRVFAPITEYIDTLVTSGTTYYYRVRAVDTSYNRSLLSNQVTAIPLNRQISVTFIVDVPDYTQGEVYIVGDHPKLGSGDPGKILMTRVDANTWRITFDLQEGVILAYKFTRGNYAWLDIETAADGNTDIPNRTLLVEAGSSGTIVVNATVANWRDPLIAQSYPSNHATEVPINPVITLTWNQAMEPDTVFTLRSPTDPITGTLSYNPSTWTVSFTPTEYLQVDTTYTLTAAYQTDVVGDPQLVQYSWTFTTIEAITIHTVALPMVRKN